MLQGHFRSLLLGAGLASYAFTCLVGALAQVRRTRFGLVHHALYAVVFALAIAVSVVRFRWAMLVPLLVLAALPRTRPGRPAHGALAVLGLGGYLAAAFIPEGSP